MFLQVTENGDIQTTIWISPRELIINNIFYAYVVNHINTKIKSKGNYMEGRYFRIIL